MAAGMGPEVPARPPLEQEGAQLLRQTELGIPKQFPIKTLTHLDKLDFSKVTTSCAFALGSLLSDYGWYILFSLIVIYLLVQKFAKMFRGTSRPSLDTTAVEPDAVVKRQEALLAARLRMQEELNAQAEKFKEKQRKLEEEKRRQKIAIWESMQEGKSYKETLRQNQEPDPGASTSAAVPKPKPRRKPLRDGGYNPLSGEGGGTCSWRPGRRGPSSGG